MLRLNKLELQNFGVIQNKRVFIFEKGLNILHAENGKGKSTSVQAISMLLTDSYEGSYENYINDSKDNFSISLDFVLDSQEYTISLSCNKAKNVTTERTLSSQGKVLATGDDAKNKLASLLDPVLTQYSLIAKQSTTDNIVTCKDAERRDLFKKIKDIDYSREVTSTLDEKLKAFDDKIVEIDKEIYSLENQKYEETPLLPLPFDSSIFDSKKKEFQNIQNEKTLVEEKQKQVIEKEISLENKKSRNLTLDTLISEKNTIKDSYSGIISSCTEASIEEEATIYKKEIECKKVSYEENIKQLQNNVKKEIEDVEKIIQEKEKKKKEDESSSSLIIVSKIPAFDDKELKETSSAIATTEANIKRYSSDLQSLEQGVCPVCGGDCKDKLEETKQKISTLEQEKKVLLEKKETLEVSKKEYENKVEVNQKNKELKENLNHSISLLADQINSLQETINEKNKNFEVLKSEKASSHEKEIALLETKIALIKETKQKQKDDAILSLARIEKDITLFVSEKESNNKEIESLTSWIKDHPKGEGFSKIEIFNSLQKEIEDYSSLLVSNAEKEKNNKILKIKKEENEKTLEEKKKGKKDIVKQRYDVEQAKNILLKSFPNYVIDKSVQDIENNMNQFIEDIYYKPLNVSLRPTATAIKLEYGQGLRKLPAHRLSGAESKLVSVSFINNFNKYIQLSCLIMDEPDAALSEKTKESFYSILLNMKDVYEQFIIITHSDKMLNYMRANASPNIINF